MKTHTIALCAVLSALSVFAQPPPPADEAAPRRERPPRLEEGQRRSPLRDHAPAERYLEFLKSKNPEEFERMRALREEDPEAFRRALRAKVYEARERMGAADGERRMAHPLATQIQALQSAQSPEEREAATTALRKRIGEVVDRQLEMRERRIEEVREELDKLEKQHQQDVDRRAELIEAHLLRILGSQAAETP